MVKFLVTIGSLCLMAALFLPLYANFQGGGAYEVIDSVWYRPLIYTGFALVFIPSILGTLFSLRTVKSGEPAVGLIERVQQTGTYINEQPQLELEVIVTRHGQQPYPARTRAVIPQTALAQFQPGSIIPLLVSPKDPAKVGIDLQGRVSQTDVQNLLHERMMQQGVPQDIMEIAQHGEQFYAKVMDVVPLGSSAPGKVRLQLTLSITTNQGDTVTVNTQKEIFETQLPQVQQGHVIRVMYSRAHPSEVALALPTGEEELRRVFGQNQ